MLGQVISSNLRNRMFITVSKRGAYTAATQPKVFVNKHTKVICQGMTGKHVI